MRSGKLENVGGWFDKREWLIVLSLITFALLLRLPLLSDWVRADEQIVFSTARAPLWGDFVRMMFYHPHPPLTYLLMKPFLLFGYSVESVRMLSLLSGLANVVLTYMVLGMVCQYTVSRYLGTMLISAVSLFVMQSVDARQYSIVLFFVWLVLYCFLKWDVNAKEFDYGRHVKMSALIFLALLADYSAVFACASLTVVILLDLFRKNYSVKCKSGVVGIYFVSFFVIGLLFIWQFSAHVPQYGHIRQGVYLAATYNVRDIVLFFGKQLYLYSGILCMNPVGFLILLVVLAGLFFRSEGKCGEKCWQLSWILCLSILFLFIAALLKYFPFGPLRHVAATIPVITILAVVNIERMLVWIPVVPYNKKAIAVFILAVISFALVRNLTTVPDFGKSAYASTRQALQLDDSSVKTAPVVSNYAGRVFYDWWMNPAATARFKRHGGSFMEFDYDGVEVRQYSGVDQNIDEMLEAVSQHVISQGECWIVIAVQEFALQEKPLSVQRAFEEKLGKYDSLRFDFINMYRPAEYDLYTLVAKVVSNQNIDLENHYE